MTGEFAMIEKAPRRSFIFRILDGTARRPTEVGEARVDYGLVFAERLRARTVVLSRR